MYYSIYKTIGSKYSLSCWDLILTRNSLSITDISESLCRHLETRIRLLLTANLIEIPKWRRHRKRRTRHVNTPWCYSSLGLSLSGHYCILRRVHEEVSVCMHLLRVWTMTFEEEACNSAYKSLHNHSLDKWQFRVRLTVLFALSDQQQSREWRTWDCQVRSL